MTTLCEQLADRYAWPGGYPLYGITADGEALCADCGQLPEVRAANPNDPLDDQWRLIAVGVNWEDDDLRCSHCGERIWSAYAEEEEPHADDCECEECADETLSEPRDHERGAFDDGGGIALRVVAVNRRTGRWQVRMVGDDYRWWVDPEDLTEISRGEFCGICGQLGCHHDGYTEEDDDE